MGPGAEGERLSTTLVRSRHEQDWLRVRPPVRRLTIDVLGGLALSMDGTRVALGNKKGRALLAWLAIEKRRAVPREVIRALFWSESSEQHADGSLRTTVHDINSALEPHGMAPMPRGRGDIGLDPDQVDLDIDRALATIAQGRLPTGLGDIDRMLAGLERISGEFDAWLEQTRREARARLIAALETASEDGALPSPARRRLAEAAVRLDPLNENATRIVMRLAAEAGETGVALRAYEALNDALGTELDMEPSEATKALWVAIKAGTLGPAAVPAAIARPVPRMTLPMVAVLPLHLSGAEANAMVAECIQEGVIRVLAGFREPAVMSWNSTRSLSSHGSGEEIARRHGAAYLVSGSLRQSGGSCRVSMELVDLASGGVLGTPTFDAEAVDIFDMQDRIAAAIGHALAPQINASELRRSHGQPAADLGDYHRMLGARVLMHRLEPGDFVEAGMLLHAATTDSTFGSLFATLADWYSLRIFQRLSTDREADMAAMFAALRRALALDPGHARAKAQLGHNLTMLSARHDEALGLFAEALDDAPGDAEVQGWSTPTLVYSGRAAEAVRRAEWAMRLSPRDPFLFRYQSMRALAHYAAGDLEEAAHWARTSEATNPRYLVTLRLLAAACVGLGRMEEAREAARRHVALEPGLTVGRMGIDRYCRDKTLFARWTREMVAAGLPA